MVGGIKEKEVRKMQWEVVVALIIAIPVILFPAAFVWYLNVGGIVQAVKQVKAAKKAEKATVTC